MPAPTCAACSVLPPRLLSDDMHMIVQDVLNTRNAYVLFYCRTNMKQRAPHMAAHELPDSPQAPPLAPPRATTAGARHIEFFWILLIHPRLSYGVPQTLGWLRPGCRPHKGSRHESKKERQGGAQDCIKGEITNVCATNCGNAIALRALSGVSML